MLVAPFFIIATLKVKRDAVFLSFAIFNKTPLLSRIESSIFVSLLEDSKTVLTMIGFTWKNLKKVLLLAGVIVSSHFACEAQQVFPKKQNGYILFISSVNFHQEWTKNLYWYMYTHMQDLNVPVYTESLSIPTLKNIAEAEERVAHLTKKYPIPPTAVIFIGESGWMVCRKLFDTVWKEVPAILTSSTDRLPASLDILFAHTELTPENSVPTEEWKKGYNATLLKRPFFVKETIELMKQLLPDMKKVVLISDHRYSSEIVRSQTRETVEMHFPELKLENLFCISNEELADSLRGYDKQVGIIYYSWFESQKTNSETYLVDHMQEIVSSLTRLPFFLLVDQDIETNRFAGGHYISIDAFGNKLIQTLHAIRSGTPARNIASSQGGADSSFLNYSYLRHNGIAPSLYPPKDVKYFNVPPSIYQQYKPEIYLAGSALCILILLIVFYIYMLRQEKKQQKHENQILKQKEQLRFFYESVLDNLPVAVTIKGIENDSKYVFWNKKACELLGCEKEDVIGKDYHSFTNLDFANELQKMDREALLQKEAFSVIKQYASEKGPRFLQVSKNVVPYGDQESKLISILVDLTDIYRNKQRLETLNQKYELTLKTAKVTSWILNLETEKIEFSENQVYAPSDIIDLIHPDDRFSLIKKYEAIITGKIKEAHYEYRIRQSPEESEYKWVFTSSVVGKYNTQGLPATIISVSRDIHAPKMLELELREMKEKAEKANRLKSIFIAGMSREVRTPLNAITGFSDLLVETEDIEEKQNYQEIINSNNELLLKLINEMLDLTRIEAGTLEFSFSNVDANEILDSATSPILGKLSPQVTLHIEKPSAHYILSTDKVRVSQVLTNFMTNAARFTKQGEIRIGYRPQNAHTLYFYVKDTGCGIPEEAQKRLFDPFCLLDSFVQGNGLGLPICERVIKGLGGSIGVHSEPGKGTEFWFTLPV